MMSAKLEYMDPNESTRSLFILQEPLMTSRPTAITIKDVLAFTPEQVPQDPLYTTVPSHSPREEPNVTNNNSRPSQHNEHALVLKLADSSKWKDRLSKCCIHGICHPSYVYGCCFSIFGLAQVLYRILHSQRTKLITFWLIAIFFLVHFIIEYILYLKIVKYCTSDVISFLHNKLNRDQVFIDASCKKWVELYGRFSYIYFAITAVSVAVVRHIVRKKYHILPSCRRRNSEPQPCCDDGWIEDCCFSIFCASCVTSQLMRHTGNYESFRASFCSYTGLTRIPRKKNDGERILESSTENQLVHEEHGASVTNGIC